MIAWSKVTVLNWKSLYGFSAARLASITKQTEICFKHGEIILEDVNSEDDDSFIAF